MICDEVRLFDSEIAAIQDSKGAVDSEVRLRFQPGLYFKCSSQIERHPEVVIKDFIELTTVRVHDPRP